MKKSSLWWCCCAVLLLSACKEDGDGGGGQIDPPGGGDNGPATLTVSGKVLGEEGKPLADALVLVVGKTAVTSDASGGFSVSGVTAPYDIAVVSSTKLNAIVYKGVTRKDPTLVLSNGAEVPTYRANVIGNIVNAQTPSATVRDPEVVFVSSEGSSTSSTYDKTYSIYTTRPSWTGSVTTTGSLFAFQGERQSASSTLYTRFTGYGRRDNVGLANGATVERQHIPLSSVTSSFVAGTLSVPSGHTVLLKSVSMQLDAINPVYLFGEVGGGTSFSYAVPVVPQSNFLVSAVSTSQGQQSSALGVKTSVAAGTNTVVLALKPPPVQSQPADNATGVTRTNEFSWTASADSVHVALFEKNTDKGGTPFAISVVTKGATTTLPDLSALGMALPANTALEWSVQSHNPITSVDAMLAGVSGGRVPAGVTEFYLSTSSVRTFTTAATP